MAFIIDRYNKYDTWDRTHQCKTFEEYESHFTLPYEIVATDWAIAWLQDPKHRKQAKAFERQYFQG